MSNSSNPTLHKATLGSANDQGKAQQFAQEGLAGYSATSKSSCNLLTRVPVKEQKTMSFVFTFISSSTGTETDAQEHGSNPGLKLQPLPEFSVSDGSTEYACGRCFQVEKLLQHGNRALGGGGQAEEHQTI